MYLFELILADLPDMCHTALHWILGHNGTFHSHTLRG